MIGLQTHMTNKDDVQIQADLRHQNSKALHSVPKEAEKYLTEAGTTDDMTNDHGKTATWKAKQLKLNSKEDIKKKVRDKWKEKAMQGEHGGHTDMWGIQIYRGIQTSGGYPNMASKHLGVSKHMGGIQSSVISSCITIHLILPIYVNYSIMSTLKHFWFDIHINFMLLHNIERYIE